jgi:hypothetical protein
MPAPTSRYQRFLGLDRVEWLLLLGAILFVGMIMVLAF